jgi:hypothetical protein
VIFWAVRWYCKYGISYRELAEMLGERGVAVDHTTLYRWTQRYTPELHIRAEGGGKPIAFALTGGERPDHEPVPMLMCQGAVKRAGRGRPRLRPRRLVGDRGYSTGQVGIGAVIPQPRNQCPCALMDWDAYRRRNVVERLINLLKQFRCVATRYEKLAANYQAMVGLAAITLWL